MSATSKEMAEVGKRLAVLERHVLGALAQVKELRLVVHRYSEDDPEPPKEPDGE